VYEAEETNVKATPAAMTEELITTPARSTPDTAGASRRIVRSEALSVDWPSPSF